MKLSTTQSLWNSQGINWSQKIRVLQYQSGAQAEEDWLPLERGAYQQDYPGQSGELCREASTKPRPVIQNQQRLKFSPLTPTLRELHEYCE